MSTTPTPCARAALALLWLAVGGSAVADERPQPTRRAPTRIELLLSAKAIVLCSSTDDITIDDVAKFARIRLPANHDLTVVSGLRAASAYGGFTLYAYVGGPGRVALAQNCLRRFPTAGQSVFGLIDKVEADLWHMPDYLYDILKRGPYPVKRRDQISVTNSTYGDGWLISATVTRDEGVNLRANFLRDLFGGEVWDCKDPAKCDPRQLP